MTVGRIVLVVLSALAIAGCGGDGKDDADPEYSTSISESDREDLIEFGIAASTLHIYGSSDGESSVSDDEVSDALGILRDDTAAIVSTVRQRPCAVVESLGMARYVRELVEYDLATLEDDAVVDTFSGPDETGLIIADAMDRLRKGLSGLPSCY